MAPFTRLLASVLSLLLQLGGLCYYISKAFTAAAASKLEKIGYGDGWAVIHSLMLPVKLWLALLKLRARRHLLTQRLAKIKLTLRKRE
ncbi:unnamed protein product [Linum tenue]|uniref:Uncharacterized protein n=1 Tax=Linum tenue TaxID=586396 RepID=A0AAV0RZE1_9ROSI|nr:unnamed protein product [Linum tenue]